MDSRKYLFHPNDSMALHSFAQAMSKRRQGTSSSVKSEFYQVDDAAPFYISTSVATNIHPTVIEVMPKQQRPTVSNSSYRSNYEQERARFFQQQTTPASVSDSSDSSEIRSDASSDEQLFQQMSVVSAPDCTAATATHWDHHVKIQVQEARLDLQKLVEVQRRERRQYPSTSIASAGRQVCSLSTTHKNNSHPATSRRQLRERRPRKRKTFTTGHPSSSTTDTSGWLQEQRSLAARAPHEEAIEFQLTISFVGRTYQAQRTLLSLVQLRKELMEEQQQLLVQQDGGSKSADLPELPSLWEDEGRGGCSAGLTRMSRALQLYRPVLETWFRQVMDVVPLCSRVWSDFLWEPLLPPFQEASPSAHRLVVIPEQEDEWLVDSMET